nr:hypothetical protein [Propionibacteriales bacterium]
MTLRRTPLLVTLGVAVALSLPAAPAQAMPADEGTRIQCFEPDNVGASAR